MKKTYHVYCPKCGNDSRLKIEAEKKCPICGNKRVKKYQGYSINPANNSIYESSPKNTTRLLLF